MISRFELADDAKNILLPLLAVTIVVAFSLKVLDFLPSQIERAKSTIWKTTPAVRILRFDTFEDAEKSLGIRILVPAYFPEYLVWPASLVSVQNEPLTVSLIFRSKDLREGLVVRQSFAKSDGPLPLIAEPFAVTRRSFVELNSDTEGILIEGKDIDGVPKNQLHWRVQDRFVSLATPYPVSELLQMAESIHSGHDSK